jgi:hypothetical protein
MKSDPIPGAEDHILVRQAKLIRRDEEATLGTKEPRAE